MIDFSCIIPTYKRNDYVMQAVNTILRYSRPFSVEIIIIDDDPQSNLLNKIDQSKVRYFRNSKRQGPGFSRKKGFNLSKGNYVIFMDDDDYYLNSIIFKKSKDIFKTDNTLSFVGFNSYIYYESNRKQEREIKFKYNIRLNSKKYLKSFMIKIPKPTSTFTAVFDRSKLFKMVQSVKMLNDTVIYLIALLNGNAFLCSDYVGVYRVHQANITKSISSSFVLENMNEKLNISRLLPFRRITRSRWIANQAWISGKYLLESNDNKLNRELLDRWFSKTNNLTIFIYKFLKAKYVLSKGIKKVLWKGKNEV